MKKNEAIHHACSANKGDDLLRSKCKDDLRLVAAHIQSHVEFPLTGACKMSRLASHREEVLTLWLYIVYFDD